MANEEVLYVGMRVSSFINEPSHIPGGHEDRLALPTFQPRFTFCQGDGQRASYLARLPTTASVGLVPPAEHRRRQPQSGGGSSGVMESAPACGTSVRRARRSRSPQRPKDNYKWRDDYGSRNDYRPGVGFSSRLASRLCAPGSAKNAEKGEETAKGPNRSSTPSRSLRSLRSHNHIAPSTSDPSSLPHPGRNLKMIPMLITPTVDQALPTFQITYYIPEILDQSHFEKPPNIPRPLHLGKFPHQLHPLYPPKVLQQQQRESSHYYQQQHQQYKQQQQQQQQQQRSQGQGTEYSQDPPLPIPFNSTIHIAKDPPNPFAMEPLSCSFFDEAAASLTMSSYHQPQEHNLYSHSACIEDPLLPLSPSQPPPLTPATSPGAFFLDDFFAGIDTVDPKDLMEFFQDLQPIPPTLPPSPPHSAPSTSSRLSSTPTPPASPPPENPKPRPRQRKPRKDITYGCTSPTCAFPSHTPPIPSANHHHHIADDPMHKKRLCCRFPECNVCPGFVTRKDRDRHEVSKHKPGQRFSCSVCGLEMARLDNMRVHVRSAHPGLTEEGVSSNIRRKGGR